MVAQLLEIHIDPESETGKLLAQAKERPLRLVIGGQHYRVDHDATAETGPDDRSAEHGNERSAAAWRATFGILKGIDLEAFKAEMKEQRGQDTPGRPGE